MANRDDLVRNILYRLTDEFLADEMRGHVDAVTEMLREEIDRFDIIRVSPPARVPNRR